MFRGRSVHTIDVKNRVSIPAVYRTEFERRSERSPILTTRRECLALYPYETWREFEQSIVNVSFIDPKAQAFARFMLSGAVECPIDRQGRILVPPPLREHAKLEREVMIAGVGNGIELWNKGRFDEELARTQAQLDEISTSVAPKLDF